MKAWEVSKHHIATTWQELTFWKDNKLGKPVFSKN
jgi:hypothetical protein